MSLGRRKLDFDAQFGEFISVIDQIFTPSLGQGCLVRGIDLHTAVYRMVNTKPKPMHEELFLRLATYLADHTADIAQRIRESDQMLQTYASEWEIFLIATQSLNAVCDKLNDAICQPTRGAPVSAALRAQQDRRPTVGESSYKRQTIESLAFLLWKDHVFRKLKRELIGSVMQVVRIDREGMIGSHEACLALAQSLVTLQARANQSMALYLNEYESVYIQETRNYYNQESKRFAQDLAVSDFMKTVRILQFLRFNANGLPGLIELRKLRPFHYSNKASERLKQEHQRCTRYLHISSLEKVMFECHTQYIANHKIRIQGSFLEMLANDRGPDSQLAYHLLSLIPEGVLLLTDVYEKFTTAEGKRLLTADPRALVVNLGELHAARTAEISNLFSQDPAFVASLDKAFRSIVNDSAANAPELLARYSDVLLRKSNKMPEKDIEQHLTTTVLLFNYIDDKDVFQKFYSRMLAKRLIHRASISYEMEYLMLTKLKMACGVEYTSKLQRMFTDVNLSQDATAAFRESAGAGLAEMTMLVLTASAWPFTQNQAAAHAISQLPPEIEACVTGFTSYYTGKHSGRRLFWMWHLCRADVKLSGFDKRYEINMSMHQLAVLALFNEHERLSKLEIARILGGTDAEMDRILKSLADAHLLTIDSATDVVAVNTAFSNKRTKFKLATVGGGAGDPSGGGAAGTSPADAEAVQRALEEDRKLFLQASIVRIMKARREIDHNELVSTVVSQAKMRFLPSIAQVKRCIEQLIDKQFLERAGDGHDRYVYVA